jgi:putative SOS response-associated peptidase YedK
MPVIVKPGDYELWLDTSVKDVAKLQHVMQPYPAGEMTAYAVNKPENEGSELIERIS